MIPKDIFDYYKKNKVCISPIFGEVRLTHQGLWHLINKDKQHKRTEQEIIIRSKCFLLMDKIITKSYIYQEERILSQTIRTKSQDSKKFQEKDITYYGLVGIIKTDTGKKTRIKVVLKQVQGRSHADFVSVVPAWNMKGYNKLFFDDGL